MPHRGEVVPHPSKASSVSAYGLALPPSPVEHGHPLLRHTWKRALQELLWKHKRERRVLGIIRG